MIEVTIKLSKKYVADAHIIRSIIPDNDENILVTEDDQDHSIVIKNVKLGSVSSLTLDILQSIELSKKMWEEGF